MIVILQKVALLQFSQSFTGSSNSPRLLQRVAILVNDAKHAAITAVLAQTMLDDEITHKIRLPRTAQLGKFHSPQAQYRIVEALK